MGYISEVTNVIPLCEFVRRTLLDKNLSPADVHQRSRGAISAGYVSDILNRKTENPSVKKLQALALGLGVAEDVVFRIARGLPPEREENPEEAEMLQRFRRLLPARQQEMLALMSFYANYDDSPGLLAKFTDEEKAKRIGQTAYLLGSQKQG